MTETFKTIILAFSGLIVYSALCTALGYVFAESVYIRLISSVLTIVLGTLYIKTVIKYPKPASSPSKRFVIIMLTVVVIFVFTSMFTANLLLSRYIEDKAFGAMVDARAALSDDMLILSLFVSILLAPISEEIVFRGLMYRQLTKFNELFALIFSSAFFAIWHGTLIHLYTAFLGGLIFGSIYEKTQKLRYSVLAHILFNGLTVAASLFSYADFFTSVWFVILINIACVAFITLLFLTDRTGKLLVRK